MILFSQIDLGIRARTQLSGIPALAEDISDKGLISPILLTQKTPELIAEYETFYQIRLDATRPMLLTCGGRRLSALQSLGITVLYPGTSCNTERPGYVTNNSTSLLALLLIEGRENRNRQDLDWRDDMKLIVSAHRLARQQANLEGEYLVMKDFASLLGVSHTHLGIAERVYDDYLSDPRAYETATSIYSALSISLKRAGDVAAKTLFHRQQNQTPIFSEVKPKGGEVNVQEVKSITSKPSDIGPAAVLSSTGPIPPPAPAITIPLSQAFFNQDYIQFLSNQPKAFCDHIVTSVGGENVPTIFDSLAYQAISEQGYLALFTTTWLLDIWKNRLQDAGFTVQSHPLIWNKIDHRFPEYRYNQTDFPQSYETCLLARKPGSQLANAQHVSVYTCSHRAKEETFGPDYIPSEVFAWVTRAISVPGQIIYDPFARTGASAIGSISVKCRPIGTEVDETKYKRLIENLKEYYTKQLPHVQFT